jgi:Hypoxia induced protein conserved region
MDPQLSSDADSPPQIQPEPYSTSMHGLLAVLVGILMLATLGVLTVGVVGMLRQGDPRRSNKLMQWRVLLQGAAILLFIILMSLLRS